jgi:putative nucleotidyltransferase with HDIG domain
MSRSAFHHLGQAIAGRLRNKIVLPFLAVTLLLAAGGTYLTIRSSNRSLEDRLVAYLTDAAATARLALVREEDELLASLRAMAYTTGVPEALAAQDAETLSRLLVPIKMNDGLDLVQVHDTAGDAVWRLRHDPRLSGSTQFDLILTPIDYLSDLLMPALAGQEDALGDKHVAVVSTPDGPVLAMSMALRTEDGIQGALVVGRYLSQVTRRLGDAAMARVRLLDHRGHPFSDPTGERAPLQEHGLTSPAPQPDQVMIYPETRGEHAYMVAYTPLKVRASSLGWMEITLSSAYVAAASREAGARMMALFAGGALAVLLAGLLVAGRITSPLDRLLETVQRITHGDLSQRVDPLGSDEVGQLGDAFNQMTSSLEQHTQQLGQRIAELGLLHATSADLNRTMDMHEILAVSLRSILQSGHASLAAVLLRSEMGDGREWSASLGSNGQPLPRPGQPLRASAAVSSILQQAHGQPYVVTTPEAVRSIASRLGLPADVGALMVLPLAAGGVPLGLIILGHPDPAAYSDDTQRRVVQTISAETAESLQRARLHAEVTNKVTQLASLQQVSRTISARLSRHEVLSQVLESVVQISGADVAAIALVDPDQGTLRLAAQRGASDDQSWAESELALHAKRQGVPVTVIDGRLQPISPDPEGAELGNAIYFPIPSESEIVGVIRACYQDPQHTFAPQDLGPVQTVAAQAGVAVRNARLYESIHDMYQNVVRSLATAVDARDPYTHGHSHRVSANAVAVGRRMGLDLDALQQLETAGYLHDVGKIGVRDAVLLKPAALSDQETRLIREHPTVGARILEPVGFAPDVISGVLGHHERYDGGGYPQGLAGKEISCSGRILAAVDAFDAMVSDRPYRPSLGTAYALRELEAHAGSQFDPDVARCLVEAVCAGEIVLPDRADMADVG